jgi:hypothetical protein
MQIHEVDPDMLARDKLCDSTNLTQTSGPDQFYEHDWGLLNTSKWRPLSLARSTKVEHGRIFMLTASGFITPEAMGDLLPVFMSPWPCRFIDDMPETAEELGDSPIGDLVVSDICSLAYPACLCRLAFLGMFFQDGSLQDGFAR